MSLPSTRSENSAGRERDLPTRRAVRSPFSLEEKLRIVSEALAGGVRQAHVTRKYGLGKNTLARWKQMLGPLCASHAGTAASEPPGELERLIARVAELERLLGQRTMELDVLQQRLQLIRANGPGAGGYSRSSVPSSTSPGGR